MVKVSGLGATVEQELQSLTSELVQVQDQLLALKGLAQVIRGELEPRTLLETLIDHAARLARVAGGFAALGADGRDPLVVVSPARVVEPAAALELARSFGHGTGPEVRTTPAGHLVLLVPIPLRNRPGGVLGLLAGPAKPFAAPQRKLAAAIAAHAGTHLEGVLLHQERLRWTRLEAEFELARKVQAGLAPPVPTGLPGLDVHAESRAASIVGGDFFDLAPAAGDRLVCSLGDVAGKGFSAALLVAMTRASIRAAARDPAGEGPASVLAAANADLYEDFGQLGMFATVVVAFVDLAGRRVALANAGHSPVIYRPAGGLARLVRAEAPPIGVLPEWEAPDGVLRLGPGDLLVSATDGFPEMEDRATGELFGYDRLLELVDRTADRPAAAIGAELFRATDRFGGEPTDDRTVQILQGV